ncbi:MAG: aspartate--tRNA ligase [Defluviitaleaceae bacterium]|nr:aspartate--tRNA ligase [Defluviitaleaceae bacterium]
MSESLGTLKRSHYLTQVNEDLAGQTVTVMGWVNKRRSLGQIMFIDLRDRTGLLQIRFNELSAPELFQKAAGARGEYVLAVRGTVALRAEKDINRDMETGKVEIDAQELRILSDAETPPFNVWDEGVANDLRLKHRYLDLRRPSLQKSLFFRHRLAQTVRGFYTEEGFIEVETPILTKSTPEGARDYLVPSRVHPGEFYALPQSPQQFKQLLMISGFDRYFQIAKCFRDEDLRADRQPEFTQIDVEMSFVDVGDVLGMAERLFARIFKDMMGIELSAPFERLTYKEAMERFGSDKPDTRFGMEIADVSAIVRGGGFSMFDSALESGGSVRGINAAGAADFTRKQTDALADLAKTHKAKGLATIALHEGGEVKSSLSKFFADDKLREIAQAFGAKPGDLILLCADAANDIVLEALGALRVDLAKKLELTRPDDYKLLFVTEFPLLEWSEDDQRFYAKHHPFTSPMDEDLDKLESDPGACRAKAYDLVMNGFELGGGSIRIHRKDVQERMFRALGFTNDQMARRFGYFIDAFKYGTPPHGGIAFGFDRIAMLLTHSESLRDVVAFPKVKDASCPMTNSPDIVDDAQLAELGIAVRNKH